MLHVHANILVCMFPACDELLVSELTCRLVTCPAVAVLKNPISFSYDNVDRRAV